MKLRCLFGFHRTKFGIVKNSAVEEDGMIAVGETCKDCKKEFYDPYMTWLYNSDKIRNSS